jgi:hypothetical protein
VSRRLGSPLDEAGRTLADRLEGLARRAEAVLREMLADSDPKRQLAPPQRRRAELLLLRYERHCRQQARRRQP